MSIDVNWERATSGPDGEALAERIRSFIHDKFQQVALPRFIRSVQVHSFDFGTVAPELEIKDFCDPFSDFYEEDEDGEISDEEELSPEQWHGGPPDLHERSFADDTRTNQQYRLGADNEPHPHVRSPFGEHLNPPFLQRSGTPVIPGGTSNLGYHLMLGGLSGTQTPLAAVAGGSPFANAWSDPSRDRTASRLNRPQGTAEAQRISEGDVDTGSPSRPSTANTVPSRPSAPHSGGSSSNNTSGDPAISNGSDHHPASLRPHPEDEEHLDPSDTHLHPLPPRMRERRPEDFQVICRVKYAGDIKLCLTAEILLDYPMPSFVGLPLKLNITGVTFDGVAVVAYIRKRTHFCFLSPEDADALIGAEQEKESNDGRPRSSGGGASSGRRVGGLLQEIRVDSEIGRKEDGKQVLKNVGKVERFVLEQVRRIFEEEFVFPSFWTFLI
ncbi:hypothetical protein DTO271G3_4441 [Paecilomyces variotii]|nr:hypothetical protein DTO271G3_4441 [Paecilomyces variotii]